MHRTACAVWVLAVALIGETAVAQNAAQAIAECDRLAASDLDRSRPGNVPGRFLEAVDPNAALRACTAAIEAAPQEARLHYQLGRAHHAGGRMQDAHNVYRAAIEHGSLPAMNELAYLLQSGDPQERAEARSLYERAASAGVPAAMFNLARLHQGDRGVPTDAGLAQHWFRQARIAFQQDVTLGSASAMLVVGLMHEYGLGGPTDAAQARTLYRKAAQMDHPLAQRGLKRLGE